MHKRGIKCGVLDAEESAFFDRQLDDGCTLMYQRLDDGSIVPFIGPIHCPSLVCNCARCASGRTQ